MKPIIKTILLLTIFSIAMGYLETSVVVYLRKLYYPDGFNFPLVPVTYDIAFTEFWREAATIIMLIGAGVMAGKNGVQRFALFLYSFAIWDIFYYVFLKVLLGWPVSLLTWDILFLIPVPWVGPVIAPCIISLSMILFALIILYFQGKNARVKILFVEWILLITGSIVSMVSFMWDYIQYISHSKDQKMWTLSGKNDLFNEVKEYVPLDFNWGMFLTAEGIILLAVILIFTRLYKESRL